MIGHLPSRWGAFTSRLLLYQIPSEVYGNSIVRHRNGFQIRETHCWSHAYTTDLTK